MWKLGRWALFAYVRWSCFAVGVDLMTAGAAFHFGPLMVGAVKTQQQIKAFDKKEVRIAAKLPTGFVLLDPSQFEEPPHD
jgi:hypothetical protein